MDMQAGARVALARPCGLASVFRLRAAAYAR